MSQKHKVFFIYGAICVLAAAVYAAIEYGGLHFFCLFNFLTGLRCPGCGNAHAVLLLLHGDLYEAIRMNYMFIPEIAVLLFLCICCPYAYIYKKPVSRRIAVILACAAVCFILWGIVRNLFNI